jgi:peptidoglycan-associated lipoprotein
MADRKNGASSKPMLKLGAIVATCLLVLMVTGCGKKKIYSAPSSSGDTVLKGAANQQDMTQPLGGDSGLGEESLGQGGSAGSLMGSGDVQDLTSPAAKAKFINEDIYFDYDSATLTLEARTVLQEKADWLRANPGANIVIEGHTDERGTVAYNLALGDSSAESARIYLSDLGIDPARMRTVSYGEESPALPSHDEAAWARNRRVHFGLD